MKKTFLISLFLLFTSSVFAVSIPGGGLGTEDNFSDNYFYFDGFGLRSVEQVGDTVKFDDENVDKNLNPWEGTWDELTGDGSAVEAMGDMTPGDYARRYCDTYWISKVTYDDILRDVTAACGTTVACQNYAVDVYNIAMGCMEYAMGDIPIYKGYFAAPVSTDVALMAMFAGAYLAFALWRKKRSMAKI